MSEEEIAIARIKNIEEINIYDLVLPNNENEAIVFGLMVFYDNGKSMNYCEVDSCFEKYKQKIFSQYEIEYRDNEIKMDSKTKAFMESSNSTNIDPDIEFYLNAKAYEEALINFGVEIFRPFENILRYHIHILLSYLGNNQTLGEIIGHSDRLRFIAGKNTFMRVTHYSDEQAEIEVSGILDNINYLNTSIKFDMNSINVSMTSSNDHIALSAEYKLQEKGILEETAIYVGGEPTYYDTRINNDKLTAEKEISVIISLLKLDDYDIEFDDIYSLPWNAKMMGKDTLTPVDESRSIRNMDTAYVECREDYISLRTCNETTFQSKKQRLRIKGGKKKTDIYRKSGANNWVVQTHFTNLPFATGTYKDNLSNKYFYGVLSANSFTSPTETALSMISKDSDIKYGYQLFEIKN
jgi:hypothetical protein